MKNTFLFSVLFLSPLFATALTSHCEFPSQTHLPKFTMVLTEKSAFLSFEGTTNSSQDLDPSGETVTLMRRNSSEGWRAYAGVEVVKTDGPCSYTLNGECAAPARGFDLSLPEESLSGKSIEGSLHFSALSDYMPAEAYNAHSITCTRAFSSSRF